MNEWSTGHDHNNIFANSILATQVKWFRDSLKGHDPQFEKSKHVFYQLNLNQTSQQCYIFLLFILLLVYA